MKLLLVVLLFFPVVARAASDSDVEQVLRKYNLKAVAAETKTEDASEAPKKHKKHKKKKETVASNQAKEPSAERSPAALVPFPKEASKSETEGAPDKSQYNLFHPVPTDKMREFDADRPGVTDSPRTIDAGHFKIESGLFNYSVHKSTENDDSGAQVNKNEKKYVYNSMVVSAGLLDWLEFNVGWDSYVRKTVTSTTDTSSTTSNSGVGDMNVGFKFSLLGNEVGPVAIGLMPVLKVPTNSGGVGNKKLEGGISLPMAIALPSEWSFGFMPEWDSAKNDANDSRHTELYNAFVLGHSLFNKMGGLVQFSSRSSNESGAGWKADTGFALTYMLMPNFQLDTDFRFGLTPSTDDFTFSTGIVVRF